MSAGPIVRLAVFDCDGTLSDGQAAVCAAMESAFAEVRLPPPERAQIRRIVGLSLPQAVAGLVPESPEEQQLLIVEAYKEAFRRARLGGLLSEPLFAGMADLLAALAADGWRLGVATGKSDRGLAATLATHRLGHLFDTLQTADRHPSKPHPAMLLAAMDAGRAAGARRMSEPPDRLADELAARRFAIINGVRLGGIGAFLAGVAVLAGGLDLPRALAAVLVVAGAIGTFLAPVLLARRWSSRRRQ